jgi:hypothetical protein
VLSPGDANFDRAVNRADLARLIHGFGAAGTWESGDFNGDGVVGLADVLVYQRGLSPLAQAAAVPEPNAALGALTAAIMVLARLRRRGRRMSSLVFTRRGV